MRSFDSSVDQADVRREALVLEIYKMTVNGGAHFANGIGQLQAKSSLALAPERGRGRIDKAAFVTQAASTVLAEQQRSVEIDESRPLRQQHRRRHRQ